MGATKIREVDEGVQGHWIVMEDPEGNEFCVTSTATLTGWA